MTEDFNEFEKVLKQICDAIIEDCNPVKIILYNEKRTVLGDINSVKICVIIPDGDSAEVEEKLYIEIDYPFPCDFLVYTKDEFEGLLKKDLSFANRVINCGRVLYEAD